MDFLINLLPDKIRSLPTHMDYEGQKKAERTFQVIIVLFAVVGFMWGYMCQQFSQTVYILGAGFTLSCILTLPPWPMYRLKPLLWQKPRAQTDEGGASTLTCGPVSQSAASQQQQQQHTRSKKKKN